MGWAPGHAGPSPLVQAPGCTRGCQLAGSTPALTLAAALSAQKLRVLQPQLQCLLLRHVAPPRSPSCAMGAAIPRFAHGAACTMPWPRAFPWRPPGGDAGYILHVVNSPVACDSYVDARCVMQWGAAPCIDEVWARGRRAGMQKCLGHWEEGPRRGLQLHQELLPLGALQFECRPGCPAG